jgi:hypothetical protein
LPQEDPQATTFKELEELIGQVVDAGQGGASSTVIIGGVDMEDALASHRELPNAVRWQRTANNLLTDLYQVTEEQKGTIAALAEQRLALAKLAQSQEAEIKELKAKKRAPKSAKKAA